MRDCQEKLPPEQPTIRDKCFHPSGSFVEFPRKDVETSIAARFEKIVRAYPDHLAIKTPEEELTYDDLNRSANRIAHHLLDLESRESAPVALLFETGAQIIAAMLGVLKAGRFFALLDPAFPKQKIAAVLAQSQAKLVLADERNLQTARDVAGDGLMIVDYKSAVQSAMSRNCDLSLSPELFSYIVYTSGSTGNPKGVICSHQTLLHHVRVLTNIYHICKEDRVSLMASISGGALSTIALALFNGAALYPYDAMRSGVSNLAAWLRRERLSIWFMPSPLFRNLAATVETDDYFNDLRLIRLRSDKVYRSDIELCKRIAPPNCVIATGLATTETGTISMNLLNHETGIVGDDVPVGFPDEDKEILLIDDEGKEVGVNEVGEITVRSKYLSPGYWNDPELTQSKFQNDPENPALRIYHTGDLGLMLPDGCLIHKGRKDFRVKIRGYAVDLVEVEKTLLSHPAIQQAVVATHRTQSDDARLTGYYTCAHETPSASDLRMYLQQRLADYMIPSVFVKLDEIPLTANGKFNRAALPEPGDKRPALSTEPLTNGKLDRQALPKPDPVRPELTARYVEARNELERQLVALWEDILDVRPVGVDDNLFDLGGHSLTGARIIGEIHREYGTELPLQALFESPTIAQLAVALKDGWKKKTRSGDRDWRYIFELQAGRGGKPLFFFPGGGGSEPEFFIYARLARYLGSDYPVYGLRVKGADGSALPHSGVQEMVSAYLEEIRAIEPAGPYYLAGECAGGVTAYEAARQLRERGEEIALLALLDVERPTLTNYWRYRVCEMLCISLIKFHWGNLRRLEWKRWPAYLRGEGTGEAANPSAFGSAADLLRERAQALLDIDHLSKSARHVKTARANYRRIVRRYRPPCYGGPIYFIANEKLFHKDPTLGWSDLTGYVATEVVPGDHDSYLRDHVQVAAQQLRKCLEEANNRAADKSALSENVQALCEYSKPVTPATSAERHPAVSERK